MKKMLRIAAALAALLAMTNFIGCKNDDDDDGDETVATVAVEKVEITSTETDVEVGKTITLTAKVSPENATDKTVTWTSSDTTVATVDSSKGVVTGVKEDKVTITAKAGEKTATVEVTVKAAATSGGETGGSTGGETGGETGGSTGGTTGGETGGSTGGETGTTTEFENTYWVLEEKVSEFSGMKVTLQNFKYVYINDSTSGLVYMPDTDTAVEELITAGGGKRTVAYGEVTGNAFTYTVEGKNIILTLTATSEGKTETLTGTIVDENTLRFTNNADVDPFEFTLKKAAAAPTEATVTVEITAAPPSGKGFTVDLTDTNSTSELYAALSELTLKGALANGVYDGIDLSGSVIRGNDKSKVVLEVKGVMKFNVAAGAKITLKPGSTSSQNTSTYVISGAGISANESITGTGYEAKTYTATESGDFVLTTGTDRGVRFTYISVEY